jgi:hypothetical protein
MKPLFRIMCLISVILLLNIAAETADFDQTQESNPLIGTWDIELIEMGFQLQFVFKMEDDTLTGEMVFEMGSGTMENIKFEENELSFYVEFDAGGQILGVDVSGTVEEDKITGFMNSDMGTADFSGTKRKE